MACFWDTVYRVALKKWTILLRRLQHVYYTHTGNIYNISTVPKTLIKMLLNMSTQLAAITEASRSRNCPIACSVKSARRKHVYLWHHEWRQKQAVRLGRRHNMPPPHLDFWPFDLEVGMGVACDLGYPCAKFRLPRPFGFRVRADVRDIRQTNRRTTDADDRLMLRGGGIIIFHMSIELYCKEY